MIRHLLLHMAYLDDPAYSVGRLQFSWADDRKLDAQAVRYGRELWSGDAG